jgi:hypothetical protein
MNYKPPNAGIVEMEAEPPIGVVISVVVVVGPVVAVGGVVVGVVVAEEEVVAVAAEDVLLPPNVSNWRAINRMSPNVTYLPVVPCVG